MAREVLGWFGFLGLAAPFLWYGIRLLRRAKIKRGWRKSAFLICGSILCAPGIAWPLCVLEFAFRANRTECVSHGHHVGFMGQVVHLDGTSSVSRTEYTEFELRGSRKTMSCSTPAEVTFREGRLFDATWVLGCRSKPRCTP